MQGCDDRHCGNPCYVSNVFEKCVVIRGLPRFVQVRLQHNSLGEQSTRNLCRLARDTDLAVRPVCLSVCNFAVRPTR